MSAPSRRSSSAVYRAAWFIRGPGAQEIPVVPCDDAAVERVARALFEDYSSEYDTTWEQDRDAFMAAAEKVLRAAGETP